MLNQMVRVACLRSSGSIDNPVVCFRFTGSCPASPFIYSTLNCGIWGEEHLWAIEVKAAQDFITSAADIRLLSTVGHFFALLCSLKCVWSKVGLKLLLFSVCWSFNHFFEKLFWKMPVNGKYCYHDILKSSILLAGLCKRMKNNKYWNFLQLKWKIC